MGLESQPQGQRQRAFLQGEQGAAYWSWREGDQEGWRQQAGPPNPPEAAITAEQEGEEPQHLTPKCTQVA